MFAGKIQIFRDSDDSSFLENFSKLSAGKESCTVHVHHQGSRGMHFLISLHRFALSGELALLTLSGESGHAGKALKPEPPFLVAIHTTPKERSKTLCNLLLLSQVSRELSTL